MMNLGKSVQFELFAPLLSKMVLNASISLQVNQHFDLHEQDDLLRETSKTFAASSRFTKNSRTFSEWKEQRKRIEQLEAEIVRLRTSGGGDDSISIDGVRVVIMEVEGNLKQLTSMLQELTRDSNTPTLAVLDQEGGGKLMVACTEESIASERYNAVELLRSIIPHIRGGGVVGQQWRKEAVHMQKDWTCTASEGFCSIVK